jgi:two-component system, NarL family, invasion response regulator UvrY
MKVLIIDDHEVVRRGVKHVLEVLYKPTLIEEAHNQQMANAAIASHDFTLVIMDVQLPNCDTMELLKQLLQQKPALKILMFSMLPEKIYAAPYYHGGAMGFVSKSAGVGELTKAIELALNGRKYYSENFSASEASEAENSTHYNPFDKLSKREMDAASLLLKGISITEIAHQLDITTSTAASYKAHIFHKLNVANIGQLTDLARLHLK